MRLSANGSSSSGGQALNFWAERYLERAPELLEGAPYTSKDVDFLGGSLEVVACARSLNGTARTASFDDATPNTGTVVFTGEDGAQETIDFLADPPFGLKVGEVERLALSFDIGEGLILRVMHPFHCMQSRVKNVMGLDGYQTPHALSQLHPSVVCAREFLRELLEHDERKAVQKWFQRAYKFAARDRDAIGVFRTHGVDTFGVVFPDTRLPGFTSRSYPRMVTALASRRALELGAPRSST